MAFIVAIVGAPNVGKSTLFNRLIRKKKAIVDDRPGVTRDRNYETVTWEGKTFSLVDTGGFGWDPKTPMERALQNQIEASLEEADLVLMVTDGKAGLTPADIQVLRRLRKAAKPVLFAVNKLDHPKKDEEILSEYYRLGLETLYPISALHGRGIQELQQALLQFVPDSEPEIDADPRIKMAVIGRPNVGKSTLVNSLLGYERVLVSPEPGTTRDPIDTPFEFQGQRFLLIDTAGIRRKSRIDPGLERYSVMGAIRVIDHCDLAVLLLDALEGPTDQDARIAGLAFESLGETDSAVARLERVIEPGRFEEVTDRYRSGASAHPFALFRPAFAFLADHGPS